MKKSLLVFASIFALTFTAKAQNAFNGIESIILANASDAAKITKAYSEPAMKGLIHGMNKGWYHTAKVHKLFGFDISLGFNASFIPSKDEIFRFADLNLSGISSSPATSPTVAGGNVPNGDIVEVTLPANSDPDINNGVHPELTAQFTMPGGVKDDLPLNAIPTPAVQFSMGLPWKMDAMIRLVPEVGSDDVKGNLLGLGLKKEITSWFGPMDKTPLHISLLAAYTSMSVDYDIQNGSSISGTGQKAEYKLNSYTVQAIASLNFPVINFYGGIGFSGGSSDFNVLGTYNLEYQTGLPAPSNTISKTATDPIAIDTSVSGLEATIGARISLGFFKFFGSYSLQEYNALNAGIAFSFR